MICGKLYFRHFCKFMLCFKCVYFVVFTHEMIVYIRFWFIGQFCKYAGNCLCMNL